MRNRIVPYLGDKPEVGYQDEMNNHFAWAPSDDFPQWTITSRYDRNLSHDYADTEAEAMRLLANRLTNPLFNKI